jgi:hypothetical protein
MSWKNRLKRKFGIGKQSTLKKKYKYSWFGRKKDKEAKEGKRYVK